MTSLSSVTLFTGRERSIAFAFLLRLSDVEQLILAVEVLKVVSIKRENVMPETGRFRSNRLFGKNGRHQKVDQMVLKYQTSKVKSRQSALF